MAVSPAGSARLSRFLDRPSDRKLKGPQGVRGMAQMDIITLHRDSARDAIPTLGHLAV
jgi:hypothetical protein